MATARVFPDAQVTLTITPTGQAQAPDVVLGNVDSFFFHNSAGFPVKIEFSTIFQPITVPAGQNSNPMSLPGAGNFTINYGVKNANTGQVTGGPYGIQFGTGPIGITLQGGSGTPATVSIPYNGQIQFTSDANYDIAWSQPGIFLITTVAAGVNAAAAAQNVPTATAVTYTLTPKIQGTRGGGTVRINS